MMEIWFIFTIFYSLLRYTNPCANNKYNRTSQRCCYNYRLIDGNCIECPPGYVGMDCSSECPSHFFGRLCISQCNCSRGYECDIRIGCVKSKNYQDAIVAEHLAYTVSGGFVLGILVSIAALILIKYRYKCSTQHRTKHETNAEKEERSSSNSDGYGPIDQEQTFNINTYCNVSNRNLQENLLTNCNENINNEVHKSSSLSIDNRYDVVTSKIYPGMYAKQSSNIHHEGENRNFGHYTNLSPKCTADMAISDSLKNTKLSDLGIPQDINNPKLYSPNKMPYAELQIWEAQEHVYCLPKT